jgi:hypothetical protein
MVDSPQGLFLLDERLGQGGLMGAAGTEDQTPA